MAWSRSTERAVAVITGGLSRCPLACDFAGSCVVDRVLSGHDDREVLELSHHPVASAVLSEPRWFELTFSGIWDLLKPDTRSPLGSRYVESCGCCGG